MNLYLDKNLPTQPNNCRFLRENGQRLFLLQGHLTLSVTPDCGKIKKFGPEEVHKAVFSLKKKPVSYLFVIFYDF